MLKKLMFIYILFLTACSGSFKEKMGFTAHLPDEFMVETNKNLSIPENFNNLPKNLPKPQESDDSNKLVINDNKFTPGENAVLNHLTTSEGKEVRNSEQDKNVKKRKGLLEFLFD